MTLTVEAAGSQDLCEVMPMPNKDTLLPVPRGDRQSDRSLKPLTAIAASNKSKEGCARARLIGCFVRPDEVALAVMLVAGNDALAGRVLTLSAGRRLRATREWLGASDNSYG
jgi:hypothetical protein